MRVIDLLNKIANGEKIPEKFRYAGQIYEVRGSNITDEDGDSILASIFYDFSNINDEVEVIEENQEDEEITEWSNFAISEMKKEKNLSGIKKYLEVVMRTQNEIIEKINKD